MWDNSTDSSMKKLYEKKTPKGTLLVYQTKLFGKILTIDDQVLISEKDSFIWHEMLAHPVLFTHPKPQKVAIVGNVVGVLNEVLKHQNVCEIDCINTNKDLDETINRFFFNQYQAHQDPRVKYIQAEEASDGLYDVIIQTEELKADPNLLNVNGILIQPCHAFMLEPNVLQSAYQRIQQAGFTHWQYLNFSQPSYTYGWRTTIMAAKSVFNRIREKDIFNRPFTTRYYNFDVHKAALVLPEFLRTELEK